MEEIKLEETLVSTIHDKNGISNKGTTSKVDTKPQIRVSRVYIQYLSYNVANGKHSKGLFNDFKETMVEALG